MFTQRNRVVYLLIFILIVGSIVLWSFILYRNKSLNKYYVPQLDGRVDPTPDVDLLTFNNKNSDDGFLFFPTDLQQISQTGWQLRYFQPRVKSISEEDETFVLEAEYPDLNKKTKTIKVFLGGKLDGKNYPLVYKHENEKFSKFATITEIKNYFEVGKRVRIEYLQFVENLTEGLKSSSCAVKSTTCQAAYYVAKNQAEFIEFSKNGYLKDGLYLIAISIDKSIK